MFDAAEWDGDGLDLLPPPLPPDDFLDEHAYADWSVDEVTALDPERPRSAEEILRDAESGPINAALTAELASLNPATLTDDQQVALMVAADRCVNHYEGVKLTAVAAFAGPPPRDDVCDGAFAWTHIAAALRLGEGTARSYTHTARHVVSHLPRTLAAMRAGDASMTKVRTLADATVTMDKAQCGAVEDLVIERVRRRNPSQHTQAVGRAVRKVDPDGWARRREQKLADVAMIRTHHGDGVADVLLRAVDSYEAELLWTAADTWARQAKASGDPRTLDALRVAAVMTWCADYLGGRPITPTAGEDTTSTDLVPTAAPANPPTRNGQPATVNIVIGLPDLVAPARGGAATVVGSGEPLPAEAVADLLRDGARIRFALVDEKGRLAGISTRLHDATAVQRAFIALRDISVRVPNGSTTPVAGQDLDHLDPTGPTEPGNLHPPSRGWHRAKTFRQWAVTANDDGTITWTSRRTGRTYTTHPYDYRAGP